MSITRRGFCTCAAGLSAGLIAPRLLAGAPLRPVCRYSITAGWDDNAERNYISHKARPDDASGIPVVVKRIEKAFSIDTPIDIYIASEEDNAFASVAGGRKILVVDIGFAKKINRLAGTEWGAIQVIAHEVGHHIAGFSGERHQCELNADYWSGQALQRLGADRSASTRAIMAVGSDLDTATHPNRNVRASIISQGWDDAKKKFVDYSFCNNCE